ncbi:hypothetical protein ACFY0F_29045 [Streptomyces sp. NPDC001544]|uniref:hypothetical protein n=1 Tax=Streptomyces sp. NPDC001544 TaxID=3364584 RepID=UPI003676D74F
MTTVEGRAVPPHRRLDPWSAFSLQASVVVFFLAGASAPTPLYATYQQEWHFSPILMALVENDHSLLGDAPDLLDGSPHPCGT